MMSFWMFFLSVWFCCGQMVQKCAHKQMV